jgi:phosphoglycolate phosphatase-like HAD superfamily hydrolase
MNPSGPLVIFDVDGTLCDTFAVDDQCFCATASAVLRVSVEPSSWECCPDVTDAGILDWLWQRHRGRCPTSTEVATFIDHFAVALQRELELAPDRFRPITGAAALVDRLHSSDWTVAFATGGWGRTARLKLQAAGLPAGHLLTSSDDSRDREEIFGLAGTRAVAAWAASPARTVLVGDGAWDVKVAARFGWPFVGVGRGPRAARLRGAGARAVIPDFADLDATVAILERSCVPFAIDGAG